jgi:hypothetical protein
MSDGIRSYGPGKFNTIVDSYVYQVSCDGGCDDERGSVNENGEWFGLMRHGSTIFRDHDPLLETLNEAEAEQIKSSAGVILREDSQGFVHVEYFNSADALDKAWQEIAEQFDNDDDGDDDEPQEDDDDDEPTEPQEDDITTEDHENFYQNGSKVLKNAGDNFYHYYNGRIWLHLGEFEDYREALRAYMEKTQWFPNCWFISDHGNAHLIEFKERT